MTSSLAFVAGSNGHLGSHLVRRLLATGPVRAGVRSLDRRAALAGLDVHVVPANVLDADSMRAALTGVDTLYHVAGVFRHWARDPQAEIIAPNVEGTRVALTAAAEAGVRRVVHVSSSVTVGPKPSPRRRWIEDGDLRAEDHGNLYVRAKIDAERAAIEVARQRGIEVSIALPASMVGPAVGSLTLSMGMLEALLAGRMPIAPGLAFNYVDVRDVADGLVAIATQGEPNERYLLCGDRSVGIAELAVLAAAARRGVPSPRVLSYRASLALAATMESWGRLRAAEPTLLRSQVRLWGHGEPHLDAAKARAELDWHPRTSHDALQDAFAHLARERPAALAS